MNKLSLFFLLFVASFRSHAQDSSKVLQLPIQFSNKLTVIKKITVQEALTNEINANLDSVILTAKGTLLYVSSIRRKIEEILFRYWKSGKIIGTTKMQAYYLQTGLQTMTKNDVEKGRFIVLVGFAPVKPAEFEILRFERMVPNKIIVLDR